MRSVSTDYSQNQQQKILFSYIFAQRTSFKTLDNWGYKIPNQSKKRKDRKEKLKGHGPKHVYNTLGYNIL